MQAVIDILNTSLRPGLPPITAGVDIPSLGTALFDDLRDVLLQEAEEADDIENEGAGGLGTTSESMPDEYREFRNVF